MVYTYRNDHLGTPILVTNSSGIIVWHARYAPFGEATLLVNTIDQPWRFPGQYYDDETGLHPSAALGSICDVVDKVCRETPREREEACE